LSKSVGLKRDQFKSTVETFGKKNDSSAFPFNLTLFKARGPDFLKHGICAAALSFLPSEQRILCDNVAGPCPFLLLEVALCWAVGFASSSHPSRLERRDARRGPRPTAWSRRLTRLTHRFCSVRHCACTYASPRRLLIIPRSRLRRCRSAVRQVVWVAGCSGRGEQVVCARVWT
jgi:hypothetical protein